MMLPPNDRKALAEFSTMPPAVPPAELAVKVMSPSAVCTVLDAANVIFPVPFTKISAPEAVLVKDRFSVMSLPYIVMGPAAVMSLVDTVTVWLLPVLPSVKAVMMVLLVFQANQLVSIAPLNEFEVDCQVTVPLVAIFG